MARIKATTLLFGRSGSGLFAYDTASASTSLLANTTPDFSSLAMIGDTAFFIANDGTHGSELWESNGTVAGTFMVADINPGGGGSFPSYLVNVNGTLFFEANDGTHGTELWESNGTAASTSMVTDIRPGTFGSSPASLTNVNGTLFFSANDGTHGNELWKSDGTAAGTTMVADVNLGTGNSSPAWLTNVNGTLFFAASNGTNGSELWKSDGTAGGTVMVKDINPAVAAGSSPQNFANVNGTLFFTANDGTHGQELWRSDGTGAGTFMVTDIYAGLNSSTPDNLTNVNGTLFFSAFDPAHGSELWTSDGTAAGTMMVKDINPGTAGSLLSYITNVSGIAYFTANDGTHGYELWRSDGTGLGTFMVADLDPGAGSSTPTWLTNVDGTLYFEAWDGSKYDLFKSDGSAGGTVLVATNVDINAGLSALTSGNTPPVATNDGYTTAEDMALTVAAPGVLANDTDANSDPLTAILVSGPAHGTLALNANGTFTYTPNANYNGADSFTYKANDGHADSNIATVSLTVTPVNDAPVAVNDSYGTNEDTALTVNAAGVLANDSDVDGDPLHAVLVSGPAHGTVALNADGSFTYTPTANYNGTDTFTYKANDGQADSNVATVNLTIAAVNDAPVAADDTYTTAEDTSLVVTGAGVLANDSDVDGDPLHARLVSGPAHGTLALNADGSFNYTPDANYNGTDSFTYRANDGQADSNIATVNLTITPVNDPPTSSNGTATGTENTTISGALPSASDVEFPSSALTYSLVANSITHGSASVSSNGTFSFVPDGGYAGPASFQFEVTDPDGGVSDPYTMAITVNPVQPPPPGPLTYLLKFDGLTTGDSTLKGYEGWFTVDEYTFGVMTALAKPKFDQLMVDLHGLPEGLATILQAAVKDQHIPSIELAGVKFGNDGAPVKLYDLTLNDVTVLGYAADGGHDTAIAFDYTKGIETIYQQKPDGSLDAGQRFAFGLGSSKDGSTGGTIAPVSHDTLAAFAHSHDGVPLTYLLKFDGLTTGDSTLNGYEGWFTVDEYTFGVMTALATGGTAKPQFDPLMVDLHGLPEGLVTILQAAIKDQHIPSIELAGVKVGNDGAPVKLYDLTLNDVRVLGYAADGGHDTALAFDYTKGIETIYQQKPDGSLDAGQQVTFDLSSKNGSIGGTIAPVDHDALAAFAHSHDGVPLTYLLKFDGLTTGNSTLKGYEGWFTVDEYTFGVMTALAKPKFDQLMVDLHGLPEGLATILQAAVKDQHIPSIELAGVKFGNDGAPVKLYDLTLNDVTVLGYAADGGHDTAIAFDYTKGIETIYQQKPDGSLDAGQRFAFGLGSSKDGSTGGTIAPVSHDTLAAFAHSHDGVPLTYLLKFDGLTTGDSTLNGYEGWFTVDEYTFGVMTALATGGTAKPQFDPLMVDLHGLPEGLVTILQAAIKDQHIPSIELAGVKVGNDGAPVKLYDLTLNDVRVLGYAADGGHDAALAFDYTKGIETIYQQKPDGSLDAGQQVTFDLSSKNGSIGGTIAPVDHDALAAFAHSHDGVPLTYLLKFDGLTTGDSTLKGYEGWFTVDEYTFGVMTALAKPKFDPLMVDLHGLPEGLVTLLQDASSRHDIELAGVKVGDDGSALKLYDLKLNSATVAGYAADGGHDTAVAFDYTKGIETIYQQKPDGSLDAGQRFAFGLGSSKDSAGGTMAPVDHDALAAFAHSHDGDSLTYFFKVDGATGDSTLKGYEGWFTVDAFTFGELFATGGGATGGTSRPQFDPLMVDLHGLPEGLASLQGDVGRNVGNVELAGVKVGNDGTASQLYDLTLKNATVGGHATDSGHDTAVAFDYKGGTETVHQQTPNGGLDAGQTFTFDTTGGTIAPVTHDALAAFAHLHVNDFLV